MNVSHFFIIFTGQNEKKSRATISSNKLGWLDAIGNAFNEALKMLITILTSFKKFKQNMSHKTLCRYIKRTAYLFKSLTITLNIIKIFSF